MRLATDNRAVTPRDLVLLTLLGAIWGASFLFIRIGAPALGPIPFMFLRVLIGGATLIAWATLAAGWRPRYAGRWPSFLVLGTLNNVIPFTLIATAELHLTASLGAILNSTSPFFAVLVTAVWERVAPRRAQLIGSVVGLVGVCLLVGAGPLSVDAALFFAVAISLVAALSYAVAAVYASRAFAGTPPLDVAIGQLVASTLILLPGAALTRTDAPLRADAVLSLVALAVLGTAVGYLIYFRLVGRAGPARAITVTLLIPAFGVAFGAIFLAEALAPGMLVGLALILLGIALVLGILRR